MNQTPIFSVVVSSELSDLERESLLLSLRSVVEIQESTKRISGEEWMTFVAILKHMGTIAGTAAALVKLANEINTWRSNARKAGIEPKVELHRPDQDSLDLSTATDEEVQIWLSEKKHSR